MLTPATARKSPAKKQCVRLGAFAFSTSKSAADSRSTSTKRTTLRTMELAKVTIAGRVYWNPILGKMLDIDRPLPGSATRSSVDHTVTAQHNAGLIALVTGIGKVLFFANIRIDRAKLCKIIPAEMLNTVFSSAEDWDDLDAFLRRLEQDIKEGLALKGIENLLCALENLPIWPRAGATPEMRARAWKLCFSLDILSLILAVFAGVLDINAMTRKSQNQPESRLLWLWHTALMEAAWVGSFSGFSSSRPNGSAKDNWARIQTHLRDDVLFQSLVSRIDHMDIDCCAPFAMHLNSVGDDSRSISPQAYAAGLSLPAMKIHQIRADRQIKQGSQLGNMSPQLQDVGIPNWSPHWDSSHSFFASDTGENEFPEVNTLSKSRANYEDRTQQALDLLYHTSQASSQQHLHKPLHLPSIILTQPVENAAIKQQVPGAWLEPRTSTSTITSTLQPKKTLSIRRISSFTPPHTGYLSPSINTASNLTSIARTAHIPGAWDDN